MLYFVNIGFEQEFVIYRADLQEKTIDSSPYTGINDFSQLI